MANCRFVRFLSPWRQIPLGCKWSLAVLFPLLGVVASDISAAVFVNPHALETVELEIAATPLKKQRVKRSYPGGNRPTGDALISDPALTSENNRLADGIYLYGESKQPEQIQKTYLVFEVRGGLAIGALYMPNSSFDCFYGSAQSQQLDLTIVNSYENTSYPYSFPLQKFYPIETVSANDRRILTVCKDSYQKQVWEQ